MVFVQIIVYIYSIVTKSMKICVLQGMLASVLVAGLSCGVVCAQAPVIESVELSDYVLVDGGELTVTVRVRSNVPVNWLDRRLSSPIANIYGGGSGQKFTEVSPGRWVYQWTESISPFMPSGTYTYNRIRVRDAGQLRSEYWPDITFQVQNSILPERTEFDITTNDRLQEITLRWQTYDNQFYQPQFSLDLITWVDFGQQIRGNGNPFSLRSEVEENQKFFRLLIKNFPEP
jgi:hypothetical protein